jgi:UDP-N-acetyl-D-glucosamine/UDP-N-acetyl-D-galactosamine dehydrogenase
MGIYSDLIGRTGKLAVVGLGYVGMPIAVAFAKRVDVIGFDINPEKIDLYKRGIDPTREVGDFELSQSSVDFTSDEKKLQDAKFLIVAVPTPINDNKSPDLRPIENATRVVGRNLTQGSIVVFESTVYPGVTEEICVPLLESESGLKCGRDFKVGYSPERVNPGDKNHRLENIVKIVSGIDEESLETIALVYELVVAAGVYRAESIKIAEAAKVIENSQRDINIAFMNELSIIFNIMGIDTNAVLRAAETKWNFLKFYPGLVGGHCIGVDPYYLTHRADQLGYQSQIILAGRKVNDNMGKYVAEILIKTLIAEGVSIKNAKVAIFGFTFKENCPDTRNTKVIDMIRELREFGIEPMVLDAIADPIEAKTHYGIDLKDSDDVKNIDAAIIAVAHTPYRSFTVTHFAQFYKPKYVENRILFDLKGILDEKLFRSNGFKVWRL